MASKRPGSESDALIKRVRLEDQNTEQMIVAAQGQDGKGALIQTVRRTSGLQAPIMCLQVRSYPELCSLGHRRSSLRSITGPPRRDPGRQVLPKWRDASISWSGQDHLAMACVW